MKKLYVVLFIILSSLDLLAQNVGVNTSSPQAALDVNGDLIIRNAALTLVNGANDDINTTSSKFSYYTISGPTTVFEIGGLTGGVDGRMITLYNSSQYLMVIKHLSAGSLASNEIHTGSGVDFTLSSYSSVTFRYLSSDNLWHVVASHNEFITGGGGSSFWTANGNNIYNNNLGSVGIGTTTPQQKLHVEGASILASSSTIDPDLNEQKIIAGRIADGGGFDLKTAIGGRSVFNPATNPSSKGGTWAIGHNSTDLFIGAGDGVNDNSLQTGIQIRGNRNVLLNPVVGNTGIRNQTPNATLSVGRGTGVDGTAAFFGTSHTSHFNYNTTEDTYIRGGKTGSLVNINDSHNGAVNIAGGGGVTNFGGVVNTTSDANVGGNINVNGGLNGGIYAASTGGLNMVPLGIIKYVFNLNSIGIVSSFNISNEAGSLATGAYGFFGLIGLDDYFSFNLNLNLSQVNQYVKIVAIGSPAADHSSDPYINELSYSTTKNATTATLNLYYGFDAIGSGAKLTGTFIIYGIK
jgi:hypothetical protein